MAKWIVWRELDGRRGPEEVEAFMVSVEQRPFVMFKRANGQIIKAFHEDNVTSFSPILGEEI